MVCRENGPIDTLELGELPPPSPGPGQVLIDVAACGVNFRDILLVAGRYQEVAPLPFAPGGEVSGRVSRVGPGVNEIAVGDRVMALGTWGGLGEQMIAAATSTIRIPADMDFPTAAAFTIGYGTAYHALVDRGRLAPGENVLVLGAAGGVGLAAVEVATALGACVVAGASNLAKLDLCRSHGATHVVDYSSGELRAELRELGLDGQLDVVLDPVGGANSEAAMRCLRYDGRLVVVGFASGDIPRMPLNVPMLKGAHIVGVHWQPAIDRDPARHRGNMHRLLELWEAGELSPLISGVYPLERAVDALRSLEDRTVLGKVVVTV